MIRFGNGTSQVRGLLSSKPLVAIGLVSYGFYLWHVPIFAFARIRSTLISQYDKIAHIALALGLAIATYFLLEKPVRNPRTIGTRAFIAGGSALLLLLLSVNAFFYRTDGAAFRVKGLEGIVLDGDQFATFRLDGKECFNQRIGNNCEH